MQPAANVLTGATSLINMEDLPINNNNGQSYGYMHFRKTAQIADGVHTIKTPGRVRDLAVFMVDRKRLTSAWDSYDKTSSFGYFGALYKMINFTMRTIPESKL